MEIPHAQQEAVDFDENMWMCPSTEAGAVPSRLTEGSVADTGGEWVNMTTGQPQGCSVKAEHIDLPDGHWTYWMFPVVNEEHTEVQKEGHFFPTPRAGDVGLSEEHQICPIVKAEQDEIPEGHQLYPTMTEGVASPEQSLVFDWTELSAVKTGVVDVAEQRHTSCSVNTDGAELSEQETVTEDLGTCTPMSEKGRMRSVSTSTEISDQILFESNTNQIDFSNPRHLTRDPSVHLTRDPSVHLTRDPSVHLTRDQSVQTSVESYSCTTCQTSLSYRTDRPEHNDSSGICVTTQTDGKAEQNPKDEKVLACMFCPKTLKHRISEHLQLVHGDEMTVAAAFSVKGDSRKNAITLIKNKGNFKHNVSVLAEGKGRIIVSRRPNTGKIEPSDYLPCTYCLGFYKKVELWRHVNVCSFRPQSVKPDRTAIQANSRLMLHCAILPEYCISEGHDLLSTLGTRRDDISKIIVSDKLIVRLGKALLQELGNRRKHDVSQRLRMLARLKQSLNENSEGKTFHQLYEAIAGKHFDSVVVAVKSLCIAQKGEEDIAGFRKPVLAIRIGNNLVKMCAIKFGMALMLDDQIGQKETEEFRKLYDNEWNDSVSAVAHATLETNTFNKPDVLPVTEDLVKLNKYLCFRMKELCSNLRLDPDYTTWHKLAEVTLARVILLNKRRSGETERLLISSYKNRPGWEETVNQEILDNLTELERKMCQRVAMIPSPGKPDNKVVTILTEDTTEAIDSLLEFRQQCGVRQNNKFIFANQENGYLNVWQVLNTVAVQAQCTNPKSITSNRLRKYIATVCQVLDLNEGEMNWLSSHLAHTCNIRTPYKLYRLQETTIEIAKVSKMLIATENGSLSKYKGKSFDDIQLEDIDLKSDDLECHVEDEESIDDEIAAEENPTSKTRKKRRVPVIHDSDSPNESDSEHPEENPTSKTRKKRGVPVIHDSDSPNESDSEHPEESSTKKRRVPVMNETSDSEENSEVTLQKNVLRKKRWSAEENDKFRRLLKKYLDQKMMAPGFVLQKAAREIRGRTVPQLRTRVHNIITGKQTL